MEQRMSQMNVTKKVDYVMATIGQDVNVAMMEIIVKRVTLNQGMVWLLMEGVMLAFMGSMTMALTMLVDQIVKVGTFFNNFRVFQMFNN